MQLDLTAMPRSLRESPQWVLWRYEERDGKKTKVPYQATNPKTRAESTNPQTWAAFDDAQEAFEAGHSDGVGFVFSADDSYFGVDIDSCIDAETGEITDQAAEIVRRLHSYTELSPSGTGLHIIGKGSLEGLSGRRKGSVEMYDRDRYFTVTGHVYGSLRGCDGRQNELDAVHKLFVERAPEPAGAARAPAGSSGTTLDDAELLGRIRASKSGPKFDALWSGDTSGYSSQSEADFALVGMLRFWTQNDAERIDALFRQSGLMRDKWDEKHYSDGKSYGAETVKRIVASGGEVWRSEADRPKSGVSGESGLGLDDQPAKVDITILNHGYAVRKERKVGRELEVYYEQLTNWTFNPTLHLNYPGGGRGERGELVVNGKGRCEIDLTGNAWDSRRDILESVGAYGGVCFTNSASDIAKIRQFISLNYDGLPSANGVKSYGLHLHKGEWIEVWENRTLSKNETPVLFYAGTPVDPDSPWHSAPPPSLSERIAEVKSKISDLRNLITPHTSGAILGYAVASAFAPRITSHLGNRLPFVFIAGEREAGKTSFAEIVLELVTGQRSRIAKASSMTVYQYDLAYSNANNLLALLDEYRPGEIDDGQLRKHHDLGVKWRGSGVASKDHGYFLNAPLIVLGEGFTDDAAALSRGVLYFVEKKNRGTPEIYADLEKVPWSAYAGHLHGLVRNTSEAKHLERLERARVIAKQAAGNSNPRLLYALTFIGYGLYVLQDDVSPQVFDEKTILAILAWGKHHTLDGGDEGMTNLELFLEQLGSVLAEHHDPLSIMTPAAVDGELILRVSPSVEFVKRRYSSKAAISNPRLLRKYASQVDWCSEGAMHKGLSNNPIRGIKINLTNAPERCDLTALEYLEQKMRR